MDKSPDERIREAVLRSLAEDPDTADAGIEVASLAGNVTLTGVVRSQAAKDAAKRAAKSVTGVVIVEDDIVVRPDGDDKLRTPPPFLPH